jgi:integrase
LREIMDADFDAPALAAAGMTIAVAGKAFVAQLEPRGRAKSHIETAESHLRVHLVRFFGDRPIDGISAADVTRLLIELRRSGRAPKTIRNSFSTLHSIFELAVRRRWVAAKSVQRGRSTAGAAERRCSLPHAGRAGGRLRRGVPDDEWGVVERPLYLMAAMAGLRQGELLAVRWRDLDPHAKKVRVRQAWVRGEYKAPKSRRGSRGVPFAETLAAALQALVGRSPFVAADDLVFAHPQTGRPLDRSKVLKRFRAACERAEVRVVRFHDLRHTFATRVAAGRGLTAHPAGVEGHRDARTTLVYADYQPGEHEADIVSRAFADAN